MAQKIGKRKSHKDSTKRQRYRYEYRQRENKISKMQREIKRLEKIKKRNPESKVGTSISNLNSRIAAWKTA